MDREWQIKQLLVDLYAEEGPGDVAEFERLLAEYAKLTDQTRDQALAEIDEYREGILRDLRDAEHRDGGG